MTTSVAGSLGDYDNHAKVMREAAEEAAGPGQKVAMVEFFGYDAPPGLIEASSTTLANEGAPKLAGFLNGITATLVNDGVIDDIVQFGSPGSGVQDVDKVRSILNDSLTPLGFTMWEKEDNGDRGRTTTMVWYHEKHGAPSFPNQSYACGLRFESHPEEVTLSAPTSQDYSPGDREPP